MKIQTPPQIPHSTQKNPYRYTRSLQEPANIIDMAPSNDIEDEILNEKNPPPLDEDDIALLKTYVRLLDYHFILFQFTCSVILGFPNFDDFSFACLQISVCDFVCIQCLNSFFSISFIFICYFALAGFGTIFQ